MNTCGSYLFLVTIIAGFFCLPVFAQSNPDAGFITINDASIAGADQRLILDARADVVLPREIRLGLESGVPLEFILSLHLQKKRTFWLDKSLVKLRRRYSLVYYELTRHYRLQALDTMESRNYRSLLAALSALGDLQSVEFTLPKKLGEANVINLGASDVQTGDLYGELSLRLDSKALPLPLQPVISSSWRLASKEYVWPLN